MLSMRSIALSGISPDARAPIERSRASSVMTCPLAPRTIQRSAATYIRIDAADSSEHTCTMARTRGLSMKSEAIAASSGSSMQAENTAIASTVE